MESSDFLLLTFMSIITGLVIYLFRHLVNTATEELNLSLENSTDKYFKNLNI